jgi:hypothetical protein
MVAVMAVAGFLALSLPALALTDSSTLRVGSGQGTACVGGVPTSCQQYKGEVNLAGTNGFDFDFTGAGTLNNPVLAILAVPNDTASGMIKADPFSGATLYAVASNTTPFASGTNVAVTAAPGGFGLSYKDSASGFLGDMTSGNIYSFLSSKSTNADFTYLFDQANNTDTMANFKAADKAIAGVTATNYGIYVLAADTTMTKGNVLNWNLANSLPLGTFIVAFDYAGGIDLKAKASKAFTSTNPYDTAINQAAICGVTSLCIGKTFASGASPAPEPSSLLLLGAGLAGLAAMSRRCVSRS